MVQDTEGLPRVHDDDGDKKNNNIQMFYYTYYSDMFIFQR